MFHSAKVPDKETNVFIKNQAQKIYKYNEGAWIGARRESAKEPFKWLDGRPLEDHIASYFANY